MQVTETPFLTRAELARRWGMSVRTLEAWGRDEIGPQFRKFGNRAMYRLAEVIAYEKAVWGDEYEYDPTVTPLRFRMSA